MIIKATLVTLVLILVIVISASYYVNKEGFDDISSGILSGATRTVQSGASGATGATGATGSILSGATNPMDNTMNQPPAQADIIPEVSVSGSAYNAMTLQQRAELLKDIQKVVRNEILADRSTKPILSGETRKSKDTDSTAQGKEYEKRCYKENDYEERCHKDNNCDSSCGKNSDSSCPPVPDMTQYIKKDAIPCWGCSLDY